MKLFILLWSIFCCLLFVECKTTVKSQKSKNESSTQNVDTNHVKIKVSFISIGQGVNYHAAKKFREILEEFQQKNKIQLKYEIKPWGKEGEFNYCFYEQSKLDEFIDYAKKVMENYEHVEFHENPLHCDR